MKNSKGYEVGINQVVDRVRDVLLGLTGQDNFGIYRLILKIVVAAVVFGLTAATAIDYLTNPAQHPLLALGSYLLTVAAVVPQVFLWLTLLFVVLKQLGVKLSGSCGIKEAAETAAPRGLEVTAATKILEPVLSLIATAVFAFVLNGAYHFAGIYNPEGAFIPLFNKEVFGAYLPYFNALLGLTALKNILCLLSGKRTISLAVMNIALNIAALSLILLTVTNPGIWNTVFFNYLTENVLLLGTMELKLIGGVLAAVFMAVTTYALVTDTIAFVAGGLKRQTV